MTSYMKHIEGMNKVIDRVKTIMDDNPFTWSDDRLLYVEVLKSLGGINEYNIMKGPSPESIMRSRRKLQAKGLFVDPKAAEERRKRRGMMIRAEIDDAYTVIDGAVSSEERKALSEIFI